MARRLPTAKLLRAAPRDRLPQFARALPLEPKYTTPDNETLPLAHLAPGADPVTLAIVEFYRAISWRLHSRPDSSGRRQPCYNRLTVGKMAIQHAFHDLLTWLFASETEREDLLHSWIGAKYIKDWPKAEDSEPGMGAPFYERVPVTTRWVDYRLAQEVNRHA